MYCRRNRNSIVRSAAQEIVKHLNEINLCGRVEMRVNEPRSEKINRSSKLEN